jgi:Rps23 Pro-64 3,4-dihydroxylase Tpa1-like proline 4-hydroxylase
MIIDQKSIEDFHKIGYCVIDNFLPENEAENMLKTFKSQKNWTQIDQERPHYNKGGPFVTRSAYMPKEGEFYYQRTKRAENLQNDPSWRNAYSSQFLSKLEKIFNCKTVEDTTYILKYTEGDFSRVHTDDARGNVKRVDLGILYYVCDSWIWDWGGLLLVAKNDQSEDMKAILPKHNRIIILNHQKKCPHSVTPVAKYAKNERYCIASFIGCDRQINS